MTKIASLLTLLVTAFVCLLPAAPAQALAGRTFLSAAGSDSNNCTNVLTPCRHLATAYAATAADGEIYVLDPANYGSLTITHGVSIEGHGWASIAPVSGQAAITINANPGDKINIIGVVLDGTAIASTRGILFNSGGSLYVQDSIIRNFSAEGINFSPNAASELLVSNTVVSDNDYGIFVFNGGSGNVTGALDHVRTVHNAVHGLTFENVVAAQSVNFTVSDSVSANNVSDGVYASAISGTTTEVMVRNCTIANNNIGLVATNTGTAILRVTRSTITGNGTGWEIGNSGVVTSYADNNIDGNTNANTEPPNPLTYK